jgi:hypothetical protein
MTIELDPEVLNVTHPVKGATWAQPGYAVGRKEGPLWVRLFSARTETYAKPLLSVSDQGVIQLRDVGWFLTPEDLTTVACVAKGVPVGLTQEMLAPYIDGSKKLPPSLAHAIIVLADKLESLGHRNDTP